ncbi:Transposase and inactivated derivatives, IS30 family [Lacrimispora sphenoides]|uniref:IS30 family transposase n=1 Tax=Lacrimispora sphenoides TaxID=29370 RepID=UPI0008D179DA|nr:IS30 family transposase [Lacrimispora sphenoides]SEU28742.1 Transposase and inactivated derivatives, IS30 family [Lacrimispora sphenoides]
MSEKKHDGKHLTLSLRILIEKGLIDGKSFVEIARITEKSPSTISKEVVKHRTFCRKVDQKRVIPCNNRSGCTIRFLCGNSCSNICKICREPGKQCTDYCSKYVPKECERVKKPPYVCNGCNKNGSCLMQKAYYTAQYAQDEYFNVLVSSRDGINQDAADIAFLDQLISPLLKKGQFIAHIYANHGSEIPCSRVTLYKYIDMGLFTARNIDMRKKVRYKPRKTPTRVSFAAREFRIGHTYEDYQKYMKKHPNVPVVELDTVIGKSGDEQVLLTIFFRNCSLMLIILLKDKTPNCVIETFDRLTEALGIDVFQKLFPVILTDNGTEFQNRVRMECDPNGEIRTKVFYCNPNAAWQKGMIEKNHEYIRLVIPKGYSMDSYAQENITKLMNHINSEARDSLNGCTPFKLSLMLLDHKLHDALHLKEIAPDEVTLRPELIKK